MANSRQTGTLTKFYLLIYNSLQFCGFFYIVILALVRLASLEKESITTSYASVGHIYNSFQALQIMDVIHPLIGLTAGGFLVPMVQFSGRAVITFLLIYSEPRIQTTAAVLYIFLIYGLAETVRYPYYILRTWKFSNGFVTWLRYSAWIILYPLGFIFEGIIILQSIPFLEETGRFSVSLPNAWNFSFHLAIFLRTYLLVAYLPAFYKFMTYMYRQRTKVIGSKSLKKQ